MAEWTKDPKMTGAYWYKLPNSKSDIAWIHSGNVFAVFGSAGGALAPYTANGGMFYGPLDQPPPMPSELKPVVATSETDKQVHPTAHAAATQWAQASALKWTGAGEQFGIQVAEVYKACLAEIEQKPADSANGGEGLSGAVARQRGCWGYSQTGLR